MIDPHLYHYRGVLKRAVDGDTVRVSLDLGLRVYTEVALRIAGINAPEVYRGTPEDRQAGIEARDFLARYEGRDLLVTTHKDRQSFNRYVADVALTLTGEDIADLMVQAGHAVWVTA